MMPIEDNQIHARYLATVLVTLKDNTLAKEYLQLPSVQKIQKNICQGALFHALGLSYEMRFIPKEAVAYLVQQGAVFTPQMIAPIGSVFFKNKCTKKDKAIFLFWVQCLKEYATKDVYGHIVEYPLKKEDSTLGDLKPPVPSVHFSLWDYALLGGDKSLLETLEFWGIHSGRTAKEWQQWSEEGVKNNGLLRVLQDEKCSLLLPLVLGQMKRSGVQSLPFEFAHQNAPQSPNVLGCGTCEESPKKDAEEYIEEGFTKGLFGYLIDPKKEVLDLVLLKELFIFSNKNYRQLKEKTKYLMEQNVLLVPSTFSRTDLFFFKNVLQEFSYMHLAKGIVGKSKDVLEELTENLFDYLAYLQARGMQMHLLQKLPVESPLIKSKLENLMLQQSVVGGALQRAPAKSL